VVVRGRRRRRGRRAWPVGWGWRSAVVRGAADGHTGGRCAAADGWWRRWPRS